MASCSHVASPRWPHERGGWAFSACADSDAVLRVFKHWVFMLDRSPQRTALGPKRIALIERALTLYPEETLLMAVDGCAASAWHAGANHRGECYQDIELILRDEIHIERFSDAGARLREQVEQREGHARATATD